jgi:hypothetical protein
MKTPAYATLAILALARVATGTETGTEPAEAPEAAQSPPPGASGTAAEKAASEPGAPPFAFPGGVRLNGMFDAVYEREHRSAGLTSGRNAFHSYHHLLFLSRQGDDVPVGFNAELLGLYFYELTTKLSGPGAAVRLSAHAGKILVPFGPDPLFHKSYGGLSGADQTMLPVVWSTIGGGLRASWTWEPFVLSDDLYVGQGFDLPGRDQVLNLQRDLAAYDGARVGAGNRLAVARGSFTLWYSVFWNPMRFGRQLVMQAVDLSLWRPAWPIVNRLAVGVGAVRTHVSNDESWGQANAVAGAGAYYHFADYLWVRAYLADWLYLQARSGLATFDNRTGVFYDASRASPSDGSHHNLALVAEHAGAQASLAYYWNFEKVDERPDDLLRLTVTYAF